MKKEYIFIITFSLTIGVLIYVGYSLISFNIVKQNIAMDKIESNAGNEKIFPTKPSPSESQPIELSSSNKSVSINKKPKEIQHYQPPEGEEVLYYTSIQPLKYIQLPDDRAKREQNWDEAWVRKTYKSNFLFYRQTINRQGIIVYLQKLIEQYPESPYYSYYQEILELIKQMQKEDEQFKTKYAIGGGALTITDIYYRRDLNLGDEIPINEKIDCYIYWLRNSYFFKEKRFRVELGEGLAEGVRTRIPSFSPLVAAEKLAKMVESVPSLLRLLEDRRPIIMVNDTGIPAVFYRYQDAAAEILAEGMFVPDVIPFHKPQFIAKRPFPLQLADDEYFSEYLKKQTPEEKQKIINDIKEWVEEALSNPSESQPHNNEK